MLKYKFIFNIKMLQLYPRVKKHIPESILFNIKINNKLSLSKVKSAKKYNLINIYKYWLDEIIKKNLLKT